MTGDEAVEVDAPLRQARLNAALTQAEAMRRFAAAVHDLGEHSPTGASLKRMFAYWESGERAVGVEAYRRAFAAIYRTPYEALGFVPDDGTERVATLRQTDTSPHIDGELVALFESQTQSLRLLDRRLGTTALAQQTELHVRQMQEVLDRGVGGQRAELAAALAAAAGLAGWQALDQGETRRAWQLHETARTAGRESANAVVWAHVTAQSANVLLDAHQNHLALNLIQSARAELGTKAPRLLLSWLAAAEAEAAAATGDRGHAERQLDWAQSRLDGDGATELPFLMLDEGHLARWRGHCFARLGRPEAIQDLTAALANAGDSVRAATGLHVDLAHAYQVAGQATEAAEHLRTATSMADQYGSRRQQNRLRALRAAVQG
ncbi:hypothetical protein [Kribbella monticola]|uniref:hypothetical protein n=1 Tax=Kribbella monticola TaxID=2185285 RepID=UPI0018E59177|nr:hypothetical protein [Kribbella monticola]